jgi:hypothetical protein
VAYASLISGITFDYQVSEKTNMQLLLGYNQTDESFAGDSIDVETLEEYPSGSAVFKTLQLNALYRLSHKFTNRVQLFTGASAQIIGFDLFNQELHNGGTTSIVNVDQRDQTVLYQAFAQFKIRISNRLSVLPGMHAQWLAYNGSQAYEPRLSASYLVNEKSRLSLGYGLHAQSQPVYTYFVQTPTPTGATLTNKDLGFTKSNHIVLGYDYNITPSMRIKAETYYQWLHDVPVTSYSSSFSQLNVGADFAPSNQDFLVNNGTGDNIGIELTLERFFNRGWYFLITGSLFESKYVGSDGVERNTAFNTQHALNTLVGQEFAIGKKKNQYLAYNFRMSWVGGRFFTPIDLAASNSAGTAVYDTENAFSQKQADYFRIDVRLAWRLEQKKSTMEFAIDLQNVTNYQNVFMQSYDPLSKTITTEYQQGFFPVPTFRVTF